MKECRGCKQQKALADFSKQARSKDGYNSQCRACAAAYYQLNRTRIREQQATWRPRNTDKARAAHLRERYSMTVLQFDDMARNQNGLCAVCEQPPPANRRLVVDHDHACCAGPRSCGNCVRALLCADCNHAAGYLRDDAERAFRMAAYLIATRCRIDMTNDPEAVYILAGGGA